ncbi:putative uronyl 2-sulfotransferase [Apostichopus japonicus]|uniref:Putative uronyl 2-sulfotransferase n=1 Tax=Stichopus japonicus TaxID=307972 RepID=A0A2G8KPR3_STIJA|nr:putative uronyl 2-sulfotransferase [Apostichopus japonicus]
MTMTTTLGVTMTLTVTMTVNVVVTMAVTNAVTISKVTMTVASKLTTKAMTVRVTMKTTRTNGSEGIRDDGSGDGCDDDDGEWRLRRLRRRGRGPEIVYINTVRDPVERVISNYYFDLFGDTAAKNASHGGDNWPETIDECLKMTSHTCNDAITYYTKVTLRQFCGMDERCNIVNEWTLSRAKRNLQQYTIVGLSSEIGTTIKALQILLPDMFKDVDIYALYSRHQNDSIAFTKTNVKHSPRPETIKLLRERMDLQYEFFDYVMTRYSKLKRDLRID